MRQPVPYAKSESDDNTSSETLFATTDYAEIGLFVEVQLKYPHNEKQKTEYFPFCPESEKVDVSSSTDYMKSIIPRNYKPAAHS